MLKCPNPRCGGRKQSGFTSTGLHRHLSHFRACEQYFLSSPSVSHWHSGHVNPASASINAFQASSLAGFGILRDGFPSPESGVGIMRDGFPSPESAQDVMNDNDLVDDDPPSYQRDNNNDQVLLPPDDDSSQEGNEDDRPPPLVPRAFPENEDSDDDRDKDNEAYTDPPSNVYDPSVPNTLSPKQWVEQWLFWSQSLPTNSPNCHPSGKPDENLLLAMLLDDPNYDHGWNVISDVEKAEIGLMKRLSSIKGCPLYVYDHIRDWARDCLYSEGDGDTDTNHVLDMMRSREELLKSSCKFANTSAMMPKNTILRLDGCGRSVSVTKMSYLGNLYNFLTSDDLVNDDTLLLNGGTPYDNPSLGSDFVLDDFNTGSRYVDAWHHMKEADIDFPLGEVFFVDKTVYDCNDRLSSEPVMHTNSLVRCTTRNQSAAWRNLGCIPSFKGLGHTDYADKVVDYHTSLAHILGDYKDIQVLKAGILWPMRYLGKYYMVRFRPYVLTCLGDTPGQNVMAAKMYGSFHNRLCRYCDVQKEDLSDPWVESTLMTVVRANEIQQSCSERQEYGYKECNIFWDQLNFGNDVHGIHGNLPGELLHAYQKGIMIRVHDGLVGTQKMSAVARMVDKRLFLENVAEQTNSGCRRVKSNKTKKRNMLTTKAPTQEELIKSGVFGGKFGDMVNAISVELGKQLSHQSDRNITRVYFPTGIMTRTKTTASEQQGHTLLMSMILSSTWSLQEGGLRDRLGDTRIGGYIQITENLLCLEELLKIHPGKTPESLKFSDIHCVSGYVKSIMKKVCDVVHRDSGDGFNLIKMHLLVHMIDDDFIKYGLPRNVSGCAGESQFKDNFKNPASKTQKRDYSFDEQVAQRHFENVTIQRCSQRIERSKELDLEVATKTTLPVHFGSVMRAIGENIKSKDVSNSAGGLSEPMYCVCNVKPYFSCEDIPFEVNVVYMGRGTSDRAKKLPSYRQGKESSSAPTNFLIGLSGKSVGLRSVQGLREESTAFKSIVVFFSQIFQKKPSLKLSLYTCLKVEKNIYQETDVLYRADPFCHITGKERHDWALIQWEGDDGQVPAQILGFLDIDETTMELYNSTVSVNQRTHQPDAPLISNPGQYAIVRSLKEEITALMDPSITDIDADVVMQSNSILFFYGELETDNNHNPVIRLIETSSIVRPLIVVPDFDPTFARNSKGVNIESWVSTEERENSWIIVRPRELWHLTFLHLAREHSKKHG